jgi:aspartyl protease family protein
MRRTALALVALSLLMCRYALAQEVTLVGMMGNKALLMVGSTPPKTLAPGESHLGVKLLSVEGEKATVELDGKRLTLRMGDAPARVGNASGAAEGSRIVLSAGSGGHFMTDGQLNGKTVQMVVDTGATMVTVSEAEARRMGLNYQGGQRLMMGTANGNVPGWKFKLATVKVGDVVLHDVDSIVTGSPMPYVLLGNSFLSRFQMTRTNEQMVLERRY